MNTYANEKPEYPINFLYYPLLYFDIIQNVLNKITEPIRILEKINFFPGTESGNGNNNKLEDRTRIPFEALIYLRLRLTPRRIYTSPFGFHEWSYE